MTFTLGVSNVQQTDAQSDELKTIDVVHDHADVICWNEARDAHHAIAGLLGWLGVIVGELGISWEMTKCSRVEHGFKTVMQGGRRGTGAKGDRRRRGPSRQVLWAVLHEKATQRRVIVATHHAIAKADTSNKWRRPLRAQGFAGVVTELRAVRRKYPGVPLVLTGDLNTIGAITAFAGLGVREVKTPATFGKRLRYDRIFANAPVSNVRTLATRSDHKALLATVTLGPAAAPPPAPPKPPEIPARPKNSDILNLGKDTSGRPLKVERRTLAKLRAAETRLGHKFTIVQGSWRGNAGAAASADTHDKAGALDLRTWDLPTHIPPQHAVKVLRECGLVAWYRTKAHGFDPHIHALDRGNPRMSRGAKTQIAAWKRGLNGLASGGRDDGARVHVPLFAPKRNPAPAPVNPLAGFKPDIDGVDISHHQSGKLDWGKAKKAGVKFVYHKTTEGQGFKDSRYVQRRREVAAANIPYGAYHFARPASSGGKAQAQFFLSVADPELADLRPMLDLEDRGGLNPEQLTRWAEAFVDEVRRQTGQPPVLYTNFDLTRDPGCFLWVARYNNANALPGVPEPWGQWTIWQFSNGVHGRPNTVPGLGAVDINTLRPGFDLARLRLNK